MNTWGLTREVWQILLQKNLFIRLGNPLQVKQCSGIKRAKTDNIEFCETAKYACRYQNKARAYTLPAKELDALYLLSAYRSRLVKNKVLLEVSTNKMRRVIKRDPAARWVFESSTRDIEWLKKEIGTVEKKCKKKCHEKSAERKLFVDQLHV